MALDNYLFADTDCREDAPIVVSGHPIASKNGSYYKFGLISTEGDILLPPVYPSLFDISGGYYATWTPRYGYPKFYDSKRKSYLDQLFGRRVVDVIKSPDGERQFVYLGKKKKVGLIDENGKVITCAKYLDIRSFGPYLIVNDGEKDYMPKLLNKDGKPIAYKRIGRGVPGFFYFHGWDESQYDYDIIPVCDENGWFFIDKNGNRLSHKSYYALAPMTKDGYALFASKGGRLGLLDKEGNVILAPKYLVLGWLDRRTLVEMKDKEDYTGLIDIKGKRLIPKRWSFYVKLDNKTMVVTAGNRHLVVRKDEHQRCGFRLLLSRTNVSIHPEGKYLSVQSLKTQRYHLFDYEGKQIFQKEYDDICALYNLNRIFVRDQDKFYLLDRSERVIKEIIF